MQTKLPIITSQECSERYHDQNLEENHKICTYDATGRRSACGGDEGGPLVYQDRLLGILLFTGWFSWGHPNIFLNFNSLEMHEVINFHMNGLRGEH